jgi:4-hydroxy-tetrahydrodipicolinate synthase
MALGGFALGATAWDVGLVPSIAIQCERLYRTAVVDKDFEEAQRLFSTLVPLFQFFRERGALPSLKALAAMEGLDLGGIRAPVEPLAPQEIAELQRRLERARQFGGIGRAA